MKRLLAVLSVVLIAFFVFAAVSHYHDDGESHAGCSFCAAKHHSAAAENNGPQFSLCRVGLLILAQATYFRSNYIFLPKDPRAPPVKPI